MQKGNEKYGTDNIAHCFSNRLSLNDWLAGDEYFQVLDKDWEDFANPKSYQKQKFEPDKYYDQKFNVHFLAKHENRGKIESHYWFFGGFCNYTNPQYTFILDAGTIASPHSISELICQMEVDSEIGGLCGEIEAYVPKKNEEGRPLKWNEQLIGLAQYVEYKYAHFMDKSFEACFGVVSVLPGAFSGYRWDAIRGESLKAFFSDMRQNGKISCNKKNMFLAED